MRRDFGFEAALKPEKRGHSIRRAGPDASLYRKILLDGDDHAGAFAKEAEYALSDAIARVGFVRRNPRVLTLDLDTSAGFYVTRTTSLIAMVW